MAMAIVWSHLSTFEDFFSDKTREMERPRTESGHEHLLLCLTSRCAACPSICDAFPPLKNGNSVAAPPASATQPCEAVLAQDDEDSRQTSKKH